MKCRDLQFILPLYSDNVLSENEQNLAEQHMDSCPVCRQKLADLQEIRNGLRGIRRPQMHPAVLNSLRDEIGARLDVRGGQMFQPVGDRRRWSEVWLMPFAVGSLSSLFLGFTLLWVIISNEVRPPAERNSAETAANTTILYPYSPSAPAESDLNPLDYANSRAAFSHESPSINPRGSLVALTSSLAKEIEDDDELTVVADVYGNGSASITEVVEASSDLSAVNQLQKALDSDVLAPAFVPASFDQRMEPLRVVFKIQNVSVSTSLQ